ncbi:MAG: histidine kinase, partial [Nitrospira sp.]|nr:histidine kinase [Nitrospira sp.]
EREQLSQDLHDNILQSLYAIGMQLEAGRLASAQSPKKSRAHTAQAIDQLNRLVADVRRYIAFLKHPSPPIMDLGHALRQLVSSFSATGETPPTLDIQDPIADLLTPEQGEHLLNIAREALSNSVRHSGATQRLVRVSRAGTSIRLEIRDDGIGFDPKKRRKQGHGLSHMAARAKRLRARFKLESRPQAGTRVIVEVPVKEPS